MGPYFGPQSNQSDNGFEYPDPESYFDVHGEHQTQMSGYPASSRQNCYPFPNNHAMYQAETSIAEHPRQSSSSALWHFEHVTPVLPSTATPPPSLSNPLQQRKKDSPGFVPYPAGRQQAPRGTTGTIICADCGGRFTVRSSLNRHRKICRGRKKSWQPGSTQHKNMKVSDAGLVSNRSAHSLATDEHDSVSSEGVSSTSGFNSSVYHTPTKRTRSASHDIEDSILAKRLSNYNSLTAGSNCSPRARPNQTAGPDSTSYTMPATNTSSHPSNAQSSSVASSLYRQSPYSQKAVETRSYVTENRDTSADHNPFFCNICYGTFPRRDLLQFHRANTHGLTEIPYLPE